MVFPCTQWLVLYMGGQCNLINITATCALHMQATYLYTSCIHLIARKPIVLVDSMHPRTSVIGYVYEHFDQYSLCMQSQPHTQVPPQQNRAGKEPGYETMQSKAVSGIK